MPEPAYKRCTLCGENKPLADFYKHSGTKDGHQGQCKECVRERSRANYRSNPERAAEAGRRRYIRNRDKIKARARKWRTDNALRKATTDRRWYQDHRREVTERQRAWQQQHPDIVAASQARYDARYPERRRAVRKLNQAVKRGDVVRPERCERCSGDGQPFSDGRARIQGHHRDYSKPLDVEWLCQLCHKAEHAGQPD